MWYLYCPSNKLSRPARNMLARKYNSAWVSTIYLSYESLVVYTARVKLKLDSTYQSPLVNMQPQALDTGRYIYV
jgi:hypothetical protein